MTFLCLVELAECNDVWVIQYFKDLRFLESLFLFAFTHVCDIDLFYHTHVAAALALHKVCFSKSTFTE